MCGRFTLTVTWEELMTRYLIDPESVSPFTFPGTTSLLRRWSRRLLTTAAPTESVSAMGLVPSWAKDSRPEPK